MKYLIIILFTFLFSFQLFGQNDVSVEAQDPRVIAKISNSHGGFYLQKGSKVEGGLIYTQSDSTIRLSAGENPDAVLGLSTKTKGSHAGHIGLGISPGQHYFTISHDSKKVAGVVNHPDNSAHLALIEESEGDFARLWFLNKHNNDRWALVGRTGLNNDMSFAYNGENRLRMNSDGSLTLNDAITFPNSDGTAGQSLVTDGSGILSWSSVSANMEDIDNDTKITVEETPDDDNINFYCENNLMINMKKDTMYVPKGVLTGYGTHDPQDPVHIVAEDTDEFAGLYLEGGTGTKHVHCVLDNRAANGKRYSLVSVGDNSDIPSESFAIRDLTGSGTERLVIDKDGNIGIGVNVPSDKLHVNGSSKIDGNMTVIDSLAIGISTATRRFHVQGSSLLDGALSVTDSLVVGLGQGAKLYIGNEFITDGGANILRAKSNFTPYSTANYNLGGSSFRWKNIFLSGKIKLGGSELYETNNALATNTHFSPDEDDMYNLGFASKRWSQIFAAIGVINTSDKRAKKNINDLKYGIETIMQLRPVDFEWKNKQNKSKTIGLIAQELLEVIPEVVVVPDNDKDLLGVKYSDLIPVLIKAIQEQQEQIKSLQATNANMKVNAKNYDRLEKEMADLKGYMKQILGQNSN